MICASWPLKPLEQTPESTALSVAFWRSKATLGEARWVRKASFGRAHFVGVALIVEQEVASDPLHGGFRKCNFLGELGGFRIRYS